jgi:hypothetical protein
MTGPSQPVTTTVHDTVVDVVVSYYHDGGEAPKSQPGHIRSRKPKSPLHTNAQMIISIWLGDEGEQYYTLTFTTTAKQDAFLEYISPASPIFPFTYAARLAAVSE